MPGARPAPGPVVRLPPAAALERRAPAVPPDPAPPPVQTAVPVDPVAQALAALALAHPDEGAYWQAHRRWLFSREGQWEHAERQIAKHAVGQ